MTREELNQRNKIQADIVDLRNAAEGKFTGELWEHRWLLDLITHNGFIIEVHLDVNKKTVRDVCNEIADLLEDDLNDFNGLIA
jgi:hypothetical protein